MARLTDARIDGRGDNGAVLEFGKVASIAKTDSGFDVTLASGKVDTAKAVILAVGASNRAVLFH